MRILIRLLIVFFVILLSCFCGFLYVLNFDVVRHSRQIELKEDFEYELKIVYLCNNYEFSTYVQVVWIDGEREVQRNTIKFFDTYAEARNVKISIKSYTSEQIVFLVGESECVVQQPSYW